MRALLITFAAASAMFAALALAADDRPNIVFILADDCTYKDLELYGGQAKTPHINALAESGMTFNRCYQPASMCSPTRHALYTGLYPVRSGAYPNHANAHDHVRSIPHYLEVSGYSTYLFGKTHVGPKQVFPFTYFDEFADSNKGAGVKPGPEGWRYPRMFKEMKALAEQKKPFCMFLASNEPHDPWTQGDASQYPPESLKLSPQQLELHREDYSRYLAEITYFDGQVGAVVSMLDALGLRGNTVVMVATEQGSVFPFGKWTCYEMGVASGLVVSWPGYVKAGAKTDAIVEYTDVVPTILDAVGAEIPEELDGSSFLGVLKGQTSRHHGYSYSLQTTRGVNGAKEDFAIRSVVGERYRYIRNLNHDNSFSIPRSRNLRQKVRKAGGEGVAFAERYFTRPEEELYDIEKDPYCLNNLIDSPERAVAVKELSAKLDQWMVDQGDKGVATEQRALHHQGPHRKKMNGILP